MNSDALETSKIPVNVFEKLALVVGKIRRCHVMEKAKNRLSDKGERW